MVRRESYTLGHPREGPTNSSPCPDESDPGSQGLRLQLTRDKRFVSKTNVLQHLVDFLAQWLL